MNKPRLIAGLPAGRTLLLALALLVAVILIAGRLRGPQVEAYHIESRPLVQAVVATGRVISTSRAQVGSEITGTLVERRVREGDRVNRGDVLAVLRADDLQARVREAEAALQQLQRATRPQVEAALRQAEAQLLQAERERRRREQLVAGQLVARETLEQAEEAEAITRAAADRARAAAESAAPGGTEERQLRERLAAARAQLDKTFIRAASAGVILTRNAEPGDLVQPGRVLFEIARDGQTEIEVPVDEKNLAVLQPGQVARCIADAWPGRSFDAVVNYIAPAVDATRGTVTVRLRVDPVPDYLLQDMTVSVNVETGRREAAIAVPNDALLEAGSGTATVLAVRDGRVRHVTVTTGLAGLAMTEVTGGLSAGEWVLAAAGSQVLEDGARVRVVPASLPAGDAPADAGRELPVQFD